MKKNLFYALVFVLLIGMVSSCKKKKTVDEYREEYLTVPEMQLSQADSTEVRAMVDNYLQCLRNNQFEDAVDMLYYQSGVNTIIPMPKELKASQLAMIKRFRGIKYELQSITYSKDYDNLACYLVTMFEKEKNDPRPNTAQFFIKPVRVEGKWYLTSPDSRSDRLGTHGSLIQN